MYQSNLTAPPCLQGTDLLLGNGFGSPYEDSESVHAHHNGHRKQDGGNDLHCVISTLQVRPDSSVGLLTHAQGGNHERVKAWADA